jgi:2'-5' RNA ligase
MVDLTLPRMKVNSFSLVESQLTKQGAIHIEKGRFFLLGKTPVLR